MIETKILFNFLFSLINFSSSINLSLLFADAVIVMCNKMAKKSEQHFEDISLSDEDISLSESEYVPDSDKATSSSDESEYNLNGLSASKKPVYNPLGLMKNVGCNSRPGSSDLQATEISTSSDLPKQGEKIQNVTPETPQFPSEIDGIRDNATACVLNKIRDSNTQVLGVEDMCKRNCCYFCGKLVTKIGRHLLNHTTEKEIIYLHSEADQKKNKIELKRLRLLGNYRFNLECLEKGSGNLKVLRAPANNCKASKFLPCPYCFGFLYKKELMKHCKRCPFKSGNTSISDPLEEAKLLLIPNMRSEGNDELSRLVLNKLRDGRVKQIILNDPLILAFAYTQMKRLRAAKGESFSFLCQRLRLLGRLLIECENVRGSSLSLKDLIKPTNFDLLIHSVQNMTEGEKKAKSVGLKVGHSIRKCCIVAKCMAIKSGDEQRRTEADNFLALMDGEWNDMVSSSLLRELYDCKLNKDTVLPVTKDLVIFNNYLEEMLKKATQDMLANRCEENYFYLAKVVLCKIVVFNKRRGGEVSRISVSDFVKRPKWSSQTNEDISKSFSRLEKKLSERLDMIKVSGKRGRHVPILLTLDIVDALNLLLEDRCNINIKQSNQYFFATRGDKYLRAHEILHEFAQKAGLVNPSAITSTNLRKYIATVSQLISLEKEELEWLADHLGHSIEVHREFYRLQESTLEICKVSKLLMAIESGAIHKLVGKKLSDIEVEHCFPEEEQSNEPHNLEGLDDPENCSSTQHCEEVLSILEEPKSRDEVIEKSKMKSIQHKEVNLLKKKKTMKRKMWGPTVKSQAFQYFKSCLVSSRVPGKKDCVKFLETYDVKDRVWMDVKNLIYNEIRSKKH